jgi:hypothetical protein
MLTVLTQNAAFHLGHPLPAAAKYLNFLDRPE